ncbi:hypothetical protein DDZ13_12375 [Coraliomargarita sinensis]|uniref:histidine kinase n=1 Tax=Coraliomargarita sinensis TaxID=2174842 RepID=A0A317ZI78_9BACT|nr:sensor histidine kinase [Coraliomargarita sinensis]PXA03479.1 hypothetical protein DDZ13_12375 [Coraliomargarita sinensis]
MKEVVLTKPPYMNASEQRIADMHTVLNIINILIGELSLTETEVPELSERSKELDAELHAIARAIKEGGELARIMPRIRDSEAAVLAHLREALEQEESASSRAEIKASISNLESIFAIFKKRLNELEFRMDDPDVWGQIAPDVFRQQFEDVFAAIAKNSKGDYGIHFNLNQKGQGDYYIDLKVEAQLDGGQLWMPLRLIDVLRDLTANARKYTEPGGQVALVVNQDESGIRAVVEDSGCGIPDDEIEKVTEFGYRASNVRKRPTLGGGFGLTKAAWLVTTWGGRLTIRSEVDQGTTIKLFIPNKPMPSNPPVFKL